MPASDTVTFSGGAEPCPYRMLRISKPPLPGETLRCAAETERLSQICSNLSVCFADSSPERGAMDACKSIKPPRKKVQTIKSGLHLLFMADFLRQPAADLIRPLSRLRRQLPWKGSLFWGAERRTAHGILLVTTAQYCAYFTKGTKRCMIGPTTRECEIPVEMNVGGTKS